MKPFRILSKHRAAAELLARGECPPQVAEALHVKVKTVRGWLQREAFRALRDEALRLYLMDVVPAAVRVFVEQMRDGEDKKIAHNAAGRILQLAADASAKGTGVRTQVVLSGAPALGMPDSDADAAEAQEE
ncbi:MAG TPA: hypothetical protein PKE04_22905 [Clostridia bacterium]|nr:hypothetical protein [Clostridia bacterium]